ncbi:MAG: diguanylate cyclase [Candidatus Sumerlaeota bacterium]|nr:diguanylate cyclase [Candidatus Sumerlaeota bacterium]
MTPKILVVEGSDAARKAVCEMLQDRPCEVLEAESGAAALETVERNPDLRLALIAQELPDMPGCRLAELVRAKRSKDELAIIGLCGEGGVDQPAQFLQGGAGDYLRAPFGKAELDCRLSLNLELLDLREQLENTRQKDDLTGLYQRRFFMEMGRRLFEKARRGDITVLVALLDVDRLDAIKEACGAEVGDALLIQIAKQIRKSFRASDLLARFEGGTFCILAIDMNPDNALEIFDRLRLGIERVEIKSGGRGIKTTATIGVASRMRKFLDAMIQEAQTALAQAKSAGGNRVTIAGASE